MSVRSFIGPAGSGKTTRLLEALETQLQEQPLRDGERVLAITRMHGARHRLDERLGGGIARGLFDCMTLDRLAWMVAARWRERLVESGIPVPAERDFDETCRAASELLADTVVARWVARRYPVIVVDEFQDCRDGRLSIVQRLAAEADVFLAADEFQDLDGEMDVPAVTWLRSAGSVVELDVVHRTTNLSLLAAATAVRGGEPLVEGWGTGFSLISARNANVAAAALARNIRWAAKHSLVVVSPTGPIKSLFVNNVLSRVAAKPFVHQPRGAASAARPSPPQSFGPYSVPWERSAEAAYAAVREALRGQTREDGAFAEPTISSTERLPGSHELEAWLAHCRRVKGQLVFTERELDAAVARAVQQHRAHARPSHRLRAMTIQQAKNQEFDEVVVLWPFEVSGTSERLRRLLYNAITRARHKALVLVHDPKAERLGKSPFA